MFTKGGQRAGKGTYWNMENGERFDLAEEGILPGGREITYIKAPSILVLATGPLFGLLFAVFLPLIGIVMAAAMVVKKVGAEMAGAATASTGFTWNPVRAYLAGRKKRKEAREKKEEKKN